MASLPRALESLKAQIGKQSLSRTAPKLTMKASETQLARREPESCCAQVCPLALFIESTCPVVKQKSFNYLVKIKTLEIIVTQPFPGKIVDF